MNKSHFFIKIIGTIISRTTIKLFVALLVIGFLFYLNRISLSSFDILKVGWPWLVLAFLLMLPPCLIVSYRFKVVLASQGIFVPFRLAIHWTMVGYFFDLAMPSSNGGDIIKVGYVIKWLDGTYKTKAVLAVALDRVLGLLGLFLLVFIFGVLGWDTLKEMPARDFIVSLALILVIFPLFVFRMLGSKWLHNHKKINNWLDLKNWGKKLIQIRRSFNSLWESPGTVIIALTLSILNHLFWCASLLLIAFSVGDSVGVIEGFVVFPIAIFSNIFGVAGGFGFGTLGFDFLLFNLLSIQNGALIGLLFQSMSAFSRLFGLPFYLNNYGSLKHKNDHKGLNK
jgi:uncharacterized protein (TIRG00374 family)